MRRRDGQLELDLPQPDTGEFFVSDSNAAAVRALEHWGSWPVMTALLVGPRKSGRSLLGRIFAALSGARIIDDAERAAEERVFHAWNLAQADRVPLLLIAGAAPPVWDVRLPDLRSRLAATPVLRINELDDGLMRRLLVDQLERRGLSARPEVLDWLERRLERSHVALNRAIDAMAEDAYARGSRRLSIPLARATLGAAGLLPDPSLESASEPA